VFGAKPLRVCCVALALYCAAAYAHQGVGYNLRAAHVAHDAQGATIYFRLTLPLVVAAGLGPVRADGTPAPAPYTYNRVESGLVFHYLDFAQLRRGGGALAQLVADGHELRVGVAVVIPEIVGVRVHIKGQVPPFDTVEDAQAALDGPFVPSNEAEIDAGYVLVDAALRYRRPGGLPSYSLRSTLVPGELGEPLTRNIVWDHRGGVTDVYEMRGLLEQAWVIDQNAAPVAEAKATKGN
jgi:hypothetical protein